MYLRRLLLLLGLGLALAPAPAAVAQPSEDGAGEVDLLLVLAVDTSRSVDARKFRLQREGYAAALTNPRVVRAMRSGPSGRIAVSLVEWSGAAAQAVVVDWTVIGSSEDAAQFAGRVLAAPRLFAERTAIGAAIDFSVGQLKRAPVRSGRRVIDVSGDGTSNIGREVTEARDEAVAQGITVNGLAILSEVPLAFNPAHTHPPGGLLQWYQDHVIGGQGAFAIAAENHEAFGEAILSKLIKEIALGPLPYPAAAIP